MALPIKYLRFILLTHFSATAAVQAKRTEDDKNIFHDWLLNI
jgi:hypothetical protein